MTENTPQQLPCGAKPQYLKDGKRIDSKWFRAHQAACRPCTDMTDLILAGNYPITMSAYTPGEVAILLKVAKKSVYRLCGSGALRCLKMPGRNLRILHQDLESFIDECRP